MAQRKDLKEEFIVDSVGTPPTEPNEAYLTPVTLDRHYRTVSDEDNQISVQIDPTVDDSVRSITQSDINNWNSNVGVDKNFVHYQSVPAAVWDFTHPLAKKPSVMVTDSTGRVVISPIKYVGNDRIIITHSGAFSGEALLN